LTLHTDICKLIHQDVHQLWALHRNWRPYYLDLWPFDL